MKTALLILFGLAIVVPAAAQPGTASGQLVETSTGPYTVGDTYEVTLQLRADPGDLGVGTSSIVIDFASAFASFAASPTEGAAADYQFARYQGSQTSHSGGFAGYTSSVVRTNPDRLTITIDLGFTSDGNGQPLPDTYVDVVALRFTVVDPGVDPALLFETIQLYNGPGAQYDNGTFTGIGGPGIDLILDGPQGWYPLAVPTDGVTVGSLLASIWTQGFEGSDAPEGDPTVYLYDETYDASGECGAAEQPACEASLRFQPVTTSDQAIPAGSGVFVYVFADDDPRTLIEDGGFPKTIEVRGAEPNLPFSFSGLSFTDDGTAAEDGFNLLGNPVADGLDWDDGGWTKTNLTSTVYVYDPGAGEYLVWNGVTGTLTGGILPAGHAFFVQATSAGPALTAPASARVVAGVEGGESLLDEEATEEVADRSAGSTQVIELRMTGETSEGERGASVFLALGVDGAVVGADDHDALALVPPTSAYLYAAALAEDGRRLAIDARPSLETVAKEDIVEIDLLADAVGLTGPTVTWRWPQVATLDGWVSELVDRDADVVTDLSGSDAYAFELAPPTTRLAALEEDDEDLTAETRLGSRSALPGVARPPFVACGIPSASPARRSGETRFALRLSRGGSVSSEGLPAEFAVRPPAPNPSRGLVRFGVELPQSADIELAVYDAIGRRVSHVRVDAQAAGRHALMLDTRSLAAGIYIVRAQVQPASGDARLFTHKLTVVR